MTSTDVYFSHTVHMFFRKLFFIPAILAALWFGKQGALRTCAAITLLYLPYVYISWHGNFDENADQIADLATVWIAGALAGVLFQKEKTQQNMLLQTHESAIIALVNALDAREHDTQLHSLRVKAYAQRLGRELNMNDEELYSLGQGALLHDIGKIGIPDNILMKTGPLTDSEWARMREHPTIGRNILRHANFFDTAIDIVYSHHERFDGSGYPCGLKGDEITLSSRVFSVVDAYDALSSCRPYQERIDYHEALRRIEESSGKHFDPKIVAKFASIGEKEWTAIANSIKED